MIRRATEVERPRSRWVDRTMLRLSTSRQIDGLWVGSYKGEGRAKPSLRRVERCTRLDPGA